MSTRKTLEKIYERLFAFYGPQHWWPGETPFEVMVGAILTQNTSWKNVEKAINNLKENDLLDAHKLLNIPPAKLAELIRPAGYFKIKTRRLKNFLKYFCSNFGGDIKKISKMDLWSLREELLGINGIGRETADSIILYALGKPIFVVDAYTHRIMSRHGLISEDADYDEIQSLFMDNLPHDSNLFNEFHALIVRVGKELCKSKPRCGECPLFPILKEHIA